jgi:hypothetical protein
MFSCPATLLESNRRVGHSRRVPFMTLLEKGHPKRRLRSAQSTRPFGEI